MPEINVDLDFEGHPKTVRLAGILGDDNAMVYPLRLWLYCGKYHPKNGEFSGYSDQEIEAIAKWKGEKNKLIDAMKKVGFLENKGDCWRIHDWKNLNGHLVIFKERAKTASKARWDKYKADKKLSNATSIAKKDSSIAKNKIKESPNVTIRNVTINTPLPPFEIFWQAYPKHAKKDRALKAWDSIKPDDATLKEILKALEWQSKSEEWTKENGKYIPFPVSWLNDKRWTDEKPVDRKEIQKQTSEAQTKASRERRGLSHCHSSPISDIDGELMCSSCLSPQKKKPDKSERRPGLINVGEIIKDVSQIIKPVGTG